ncbi:putative spermidine/putrescine transport system permease protein [Rhizomicrobium palustre]|uniref:Putative spermidine/putrescine transport system permease protein n=1 Tax=Rhizomicrobium palustre TaxID=189966 RepID=A0A846N2I0_9PROT|nr:putative spermidine/putrescine transport system permease protein [Rhizomicrobium palustre]
MTRTLRFFFLMTLASFLLTPLLIVAGVSLNNVQQIRFPPENASLTWYSYFFNDPDWMAAFINSLRIAILAALASVSIALPICYAIWKYASHVGALLDGLARLSFLLPAIVVSIVFLVFFSWLGIIGRLEDIVFSHAVVFATMPLATIGMGFRTIDPALIEAAALMGANESDVLRTVVRPIITPYVACGFVFVFIVSLNEYIIANMVSGFMIQTLPIKVFNSLRMGFQPTMCVGAVLFMLVGIGAFSLIAVIGDLPKLLGGKE